MHGTVRYKWVKHLGDGQYGTVYLALDTENDRCVDPILLSLLFLAPLTSPRSPLITSSVISVWVLIRMLVTMLRLRCCHDVRCGTPKGSCLEPLVVDRQHTPSSQPHHCLSSRQVAIKKIKMGGVAEAMDGIPRDAVKEIKFLQEVKHENICEVSDDNL